MRTTLLLVFSTALLAQNNSDEFFEKKVRPVFVENCQGCHNAKLKSAGLDLSSAEGYAQGGGSGPIVSTTDPDKSTLLQVVSYEGKLKMPPGKKLSEETLADLRTWVKAGGVWPGAEGAAVKPLPHGRQVTDQDRKFWAFQPVHDPVLPAVKAKGWVKSPVDAFILAKLEEKGIAPAAPANKLALLRRVTFDLTGLPPTEAEIQSFLADKNPKAFEMVVDRLLASPRYGEQWGRHWLDVARYADSTGNDEDHRYPYAWRYRDYVIESFNKDLPYNQFVREQIAGDLLPAGHPDEVNRRGIVATGFLALGAKAIASPDKEKMLYDVYDEQVDVTSRAFMGLTLACARCHDHKFDPLLTKDYYSMVGIFASTKSFSDSKANVAKLLFTPLAPKPEYQKYVQAKEAVNRKTLEVEDLTDSQMSAYTHELTPKLAEYMVAARSIYQDGKDVKAVAAAANLREDVLAKWVKYLTPHDKGRIFLDDWQNAAPGQYLAVAKKYQEHFQEQVTAWEKQMDVWRAKFRKMMAEGNMPPPAKPKFAEDKDRFFFEVYFNGPLGMPAKEHEKVFTAEAKAQLKTLQAELADLKKALPAEPDMACAVEEGEHVQQKVFVRGDYNNLGQDAPPAFPVVLATFEKQPPSVQGSGRLDLANWLAREDNPMTARVMANRVFQWHFGEGIVRTPDNFGKMGERPTHPELLDYLAARFVEGGWSVKKLHRLILLSNAYQMSAGITDASYQADPENRLFSRFPSRRLTVEEFRDGLLAIDGTLDLKMGGSMQAGFGTDGENSDKRLSVRPESEKRRLIYLPLRRANLPTMLNLFDFGDGTTSQGKRIMTTVAPQALFVMNSEFVEERARNLSQAVLKNEALPPSGKVQHLYVQVLGRAPDAGEQDAALSYVASFAKKFPGERAEANAWMSFSRILIGSNEFIYLD